MSTPDSPEPRPLPSFAAPPRDAKALRAEVSSANLAKAREASRLKRERRAAGVRDEPFTVDEVRTLMQQDLLPLYDVVVDVISRQMRTGPQAARYRAVLDWRDTFLGRPNQARSEEDVEGDIVIVSPIMAMMQEGKEKAEAVDDPDR